MALMKNTIYVSNLSYKRDRNGLRSLFSAFGPIRNIKIIVEPETNQSRGMAFIELAGEKEAKAAIDGMNLKQVDGRMLKVKYATPQRNAPKKETNEKPKKDLDYVSIQLAKKARNDARRKANPFTFKMASKAK